MRMSRSLKRPIFSGPRQTFQAPSSISSKPMYSPAQTLLASPYPDWASCKARRVYWSPEMILMRHRVAIHRSDYGLGVSVPGLPGCRSQERPKTRQSRIFATRYANIYPLSMSSLTVRIFARST